MREKILFFKNSRAKGNDRKRTLVCPNISEFIPFTFKQPSVVKQLSIIILIFLSGCNTVGEIGTGGGQIYQIYPDTEGYPTLEIKWDKVPTSEAEVYWLGAFGVPEGTTANGEGSGPADEIELHLKNTHEAIYAPCEGVITSISPDTAPFTYEVWIRYGRNFAVAFYYVKDIPPTLKEGDIIKKHTLIGYTAPMEGYGAQFGFWEMVVYVKKGNKYYYHLPIDYFSEESKQIFANLWNNPNIRRDSLATGFWTVKDMWGEVGEHKEHEDIYDRGWKMGYR